MKTLLGGMVIIAAVALAWGRSEWERARYFAAEATMSQEQYDCLKQRLGLGPQPVGIPDRDKTCFVDLPPGDFIDLPPGE